MNLDFSKRISKAVDEMPPTEWAALPAEIQKSLLEILMPAIEQENKKCKKD